MVRAMEAADLTRRLGQFHLALVALLEVEQAPMPAMLGRATAGVEDLLLQRGRCQQRARQCRCLQWCRRAAAETVTIRCQRACLVAKNVLCAVNPWT